MARVSGEILIEKPVEQVFDYVADQRKKGGLAFEPVDGATRMSWSWEVSPTGPLRLLGPLIARLGRRQEQTIWTGLKAQLEGPDPARAST